MSRGAGQLSALRVAVIGETQEAEALRRALRSGIDQGRILATLDEADAAIDASHPFAAPCEAAGPDDAPLSILRQRGRLLRLARPGWTPTHDDFWLEADTPEDAFASLRPEWRRVFLALGRDRIAPFQQDDSRWYLTRVRGASSGAALTPHGEIAPEPGPFSVEGEARLLRHHRIDALVCRNAGGPGAFPKIAAARMLRLPVVLLKPPPPRAPFVRSLPAALSWLGALRE